VPGIIIPAVFPGFFIVRDFTQVPVANQNQGNNEKANQKKYNLRKFVDVNLTITIS